MIRRTVIAGAVAVLTWTVPSAQAAAPSNDDITAAVQISLPFATTVDIADATSAAGDLNCDGETHTVWYRFTAPRTGLVGLRDSSDAFFSAPLVGTGSPGALTMVTQCGTPSLFRATSGTTYYIMLGTPYDLPGGLVELRVRYVKRLAATLTIDPTGRVDRAGVATVSGTLTCNQTARTEGGGGNITQTFHGTSASGSYGFLDPQTTCSPTTEAWSGGGSSGTAVAFRSGDAQVDAGIYVCDRFECVVPYVASTVRLR